jgi:Flp pilus assembly protein TadD
MPDDVKTLTAELARDPQSLVFLRLGEMLRQKRQFDAATRVALHGLERHPHLADAHDLYARILADRHDYERAFDECDMTLRIAPHHTGALKGLAFLYSGRRPGAGKPICKGRIRSHRMIPASSRRSP